MAMILFVGVQHELYTALNSRLKFTRLLLLTINAFSKDKVPPSVCLSVCLSMRLCVSLPSMGYSQTSVE